MADRRDEGKKPRHQTDPRHDPDTVMGSALANAARRAVDHFSAKEAAATAQGRADPVELWGRRIGRLLSLAAVVGLVIYLWLTYLQ
jgi:hypothetical protein